MRAISKIAKELNIDKEPPLDYKKREFSVITAMIGANVRIGSSIVAARGNYFKSSGWQNLDELVIIGVTNILNEGNPFIIRNHLLELRKTNFGQDAFLYVGCSPSHSEIFDNDAKCIRIVNKSDPPEAIISSKVKVKDVGRCYMMDEFTKGMHAAAADERGAKVRITNTKTFPEGTKEALLNATAKPPADDNSGDPIRIENTMDNSVMAICLAFYVAKKEVYHQDPETNDKLDEYYERLTRRYSGNWPPKKTVI